MKNVQHSIFMLASIACANAADATNMQATSYSDSSNAESAFAETPELSTANESNSSGTLVEFGAYYGNTFGISIAGSQAEPIDYNKALQGHHNPTAGFYITAIKKEYNLGGHIAFEMMFDNTNANYVTHANTPDDLKGVVAIQNKTYDFVATTGFAMRLGGDTFGCGVTLGPSIKIGLARDLKYTKEFVSEMGIVGKSAFRIAQPPRYVSKPGATVVVPSFMNNSNQEINVPGSEAYAKNITSVLTKSNIAGATYVSIGGELGASFSVNTSKFLISPFIKLRGYKMLSDNSEVMNYRGESDRAVSVDLLKEDLLRGKKEVTEKYSKLISELNTAIVHAPSGTVDFEDKANKFVSEAQALLKTDIETEKAMRYVLKKSLESQNKIDVDLVVGLGLGFSVQ